MHTKCKMLKQNYEQTQFHLEVAYENHKVTVNQFGLPEKMSGSNTNCMIQGMKHAWDQN